MKKTTFHNINRIKYEFNGADIREALISHFKIDIGVKNCNLNMEIHEGWVGKPPKITMTVSNK